MKKRTVSISLLTLVLLLLSNYNYSQSINPIHEFSLNPMEELGKAIFFEKISYPDKMSCADCHSPKVGFTGPKVGINLHGAVYRGAIAQRFGNRKPPSSAYATESPIFHYDETEGLFIGGNFWDGRATGEILGNPAADQAMGPFLNPLEQNNPSMLAVLEQIVDSDFNLMWEIVWGEPISLETYNDIATNYERIGLAIAAYEASEEVNQFTSKYDYYLLGETDLSEEEAWGLSLFNDPAKGNCAACHPSELGPGGELPLFTDFSFDNLGAPKNPENPFYKMDNVYINGAPINPLGDEWIDRGLGGFLANHPNPVWQAMADDNMGKFKVPTLRNVDKRPGNGFTKAYLHNGVFKSLKEVVHFYNTRDIEIWPPPEINENINTDELGNLGLSEEEEDAIVTFMATLTDGYILPKSSKANEDFVQRNIQLLIGPNPFKNVTHVSYVLDETIFVKIEVFNLKGEKCKTLQSGWQNEGKYAIDLKRDNLKGGVYVIAFTIGNELFSKKVTVIN